MLCLTTGSKWTQGPWPDLKTDKPTVAVAAEYPAGAAYPADGGGTGAGASEGQWRCLAREGWQFVAVTAAGDDVGANEANEEETHANLAVDCMVALSCQIRT